MSRPVVRPLLVGAAFVACLMLAVQVAVADDEVDGAPSKKPKGLRHLPDPIVRDEAPSATGNDTYEVFGKRYYVMADGQGYEAVGNASWYGTKFHGRRTSSGEPYDMYQLTAAHRSLPIPSYARVTNIDNGLTTIVRVNDRGPFHDERIIDLSYAAAVKLGFDDEGTARVRIETVTAATVPREVDAVREGRRVYLHAGPFEDYDAADVASTELANLVAMIEHQLPRFTVQPVRWHEGFVVRMGPLKDDREAEKYKALVTIQRHRVPTIIEHQPTGN